MRKLIDYTFHDSWQLKELSLQKGSEYLVLKDLCDLRRRQKVTFLGFSDVDNHFGIFVFTDSLGAILRVSGDFSSSGHSRFNELRSAVSSA